MTVARMHALALAAMILTATPTVAAPSAVELQIMIPNVKPDAGAVVVSLYRDPAPWSQGGEPLLRTTASVTQGIATARFHLPAGRYAVEAYQDRNGDGRLGVLPFGWPTEPVGYSGGARPLFGRPPFERALFPVNEDARTTVFVRLK